MVRDGLTGRSKGYAFLDYESVEDANAAKEAMCDQNFNGRQIRVEFSIRNNKNNSEVSNSLGIFGLSYSTTEQDLKEEFSKFGPLEKVVLVLDTLTRRSRQYAFVYFNSVEDAKAAKEAMNDQKFNGRYIRIVFSINHMPH